MSFLKSLLNKKSVLESPVLKGIGRAGLFGAEMTGRAAWNVGKAAFVGGNLSRAAIGGVAGGIYGAATDNSAHSAHSDSSVLEGAFAGALLGGFGKSMLTGGLATVAGGATALGKGIRYGLTNPTILKKTASASFNNAGLLLGAGLATAGVGYGVYRHEAYDSSLDESTLSVPVNQMAAQQADEFAGGSLVSTQPMVRNRAFESSTSGLVQALNNRRHG